jgi:hypothetical protein
MKKQVIVGPCQEPPRRHQGTQFTCFTGTKVQILTPEYVHAYRPKVVEGEDSEEEVMEGEEERARGRQRQADAEEEKERGTEKRKEDDKDEKRRELGFEGEQEEQEEEEEKRERGSSDENEEEDEVPAKPATPVEKPEEKKQEEKEGGFFSKSLGFAGKLLPAKSVDKQEEKKGLSFAGKSENKKDEEGESNVVTQGEEDEDNEDEEESDEIDLPDLDFLEDDDEKVTASTHPAKHRNTHLLCAHACTADHICISGCCSLCQRWRGRIATRARRIRVLKK